VSDARWWNERAEGYDRLKWVHDDDLLGWTMDAVLGGAVVVRDRLEGPLAVVEVGCGTGALTSRLATVVDGLAFERLLAYDVSPEMVIRCRARLRCEGLEDAVELRVADDVRTRGLGRADLLVSRMVLHHASDGLESALRRWGSRVNRGGAVVVCEGPPPVADTRHPAWRLYRQAMAIKEPGRLTFSASQVAETMLHCGYSEVMVCERFTEGNSLRGWLDNATAGLSPEARAEIEALHFHGYEDPFVRRVYRMERTEDGDLLMRWRHCVVVGYVGGGA